MTPFTHSHFESASPDELAKLCSELAEHLSLRLPGSEFHEAVVGLVAELRSAGHDLWSFDEGDGFQIWCPDWVTPGRASGGLVIHFASPASVKVRWDTAPRGA